MSIESLRPRKRLGELLMEAGQLKATQLAEALEHQRDGRARLGQMLVRLGHVKEETVTLALSRQLNLPPIHLDSAPIAPKVTKLLPLDLVERYRAFPLSANPKHRLLKVATSDPRPETEQALSDHTGMKVYLFLTGENALHRAIRRFYHGESDLPVHANFANENLAGVTQVNLAVEFPSKRLNALEKQTRESTNEMKGRMAKLEKLVLTQGLALRGMLEMLDTKGVIRREDLMDQMVDVLAGKRPPPLPLRRGGKAKLLPRVPEAG